MQFPLVYIPESAGITGIEWGSGRVREALWEIGKAIVVGSFSELPRDLGDGYIKLGTIVPDNMVPCPPDNQGYLELGLEATGEFMLITGNSAKQDLIGAQGTRRNRDPRVPER